VLCCKLLDLLDPRPEMTLSIAENVETTIASKHAHAQTLLNLTPNELFSYEYVLKIIRRIATFPEPSMGNCIMYAYLKWFNTVYGHCYLGI